LSATGVLLIGQVSQLTGASPKAVRLYEALGLLPTPRRQGSYRVYEQEHVEVVALIRQAQALGFKLQELQALAAQGPLAEAVGLGLALQAVRQKRLDLAAQMAALQAQARSLEEFELMLADAHRAACECPQLQARIK
jgi:DNA-binding transcriptional MerR regulator